MQTTEMEQRLKEAFPDAEIDIVDMTGAGSNMAVRISTSAFQGLNRVKQHQAVMAVFQEELKSGELHALTIQSSVKE